MTTIRPEQPPDRVPIAELLRAAFDGPAEAALVQALRHDGDLDLSLVADDGDRIVGYLALSPVKAPFPALALAPLAVSRRWQRQGLGAALVGAAIAARPDHSIIVLGDPAYYGRFGFAQVGWDSPYAGPYLLARGPHIGQPARIVHAPAFAIFPDSRS